MEAGYILIVEDEDILRNLFVEWAQGDGYKVLQACNGHEAIAHIKSLGESIQVIFSDIAMSEMDGLKLLEETHSLGWHNPFIILTGFGQKNMCVRALRLGAFDFLDKPIDAESFQMVLSTALDVARRRAEAAKFLLDTLDSKCNGEVPEELVRPLINLQALRKKAG